MRKRSQIAGIHICYVCHGQLRMDGPCRQYYCSNRDCRKYEPPHEHDNTPAAAGPMTEAQAVQQ